jgi:sugar-specific transcriptional regulator TrmB
MKDYNYLSSELCKLGVCKKEADVYLVLLEIGYCSVQKIAQKLDLSRPTVYRVLKDLKKKNLINTIQKGKRNYFIAGSPDTLLNMLQIKKRQAEEQEREFLRIINILQDQYSFSSKENAIETFSDKKTRLALERLANSQSSKIYAISTSSDKEINQTFLELHKKLGTAFKVKQLHSFETGIKAESFIENKFFKNSSDDKNIIIADKVFIFEKNAIQVIKQKSVVASYKLMFDSIWNNA